MATVEAKESGAYYTPTNVAASLVSWVVRRPTDRMLDPSCGDGQFLLHHLNSTGVEQSQSAAIVASRRAPGAMVHVEDFFVYADQTTQRFECAAGNPPFIRYQRFAGEVRRRALAYCGKHGVEFSALSSSWAPFLVATACLLKAGGRMAFVVPAEVGHAPYATPLLRFLCKSFARVQLILIRETVFEQLSQDVWLLFAEGRGESTDEIELTLWDTFRACRKAPRPTIQITTDEWSQWGCRLRSFVLPSECREVYQASREQARPLGEIARVGIGYVTGDNGFFHFRPSVARIAGISRRYLIPSVRNGRMLQTKTVDDQTVRGWIERDEPCFLLHLRSGQEFPSAIQKHLESPWGRKARDTYKCRNRKPWYVVPDVIVPDGFLTYMSGNGPSFVPNSTKCTCSNTIHAVRMKPGHLPSEISEVWDHPLTQLSTEIEGHPLGGGMLKLEPREALRILLPRLSLRLSKRELQCIRDSREVIRSWRHYD